MFIYTKISLAVMFIIITTTIAEITGRLDVKYGPYIIFAGLIVQLIMLVILLWTLLKRKKYIRNGVKIIRYRFEDKYIKGDTDILPKFMTTTNPIKSSIFEIYLETKDFKCLSGFGIYKIEGDNPAKMTDIGKHVLYANVDAVNDLFIFIANIIVRPDEKVNFKFGDDINVKKFFIGELYLP